MSEYSGDYNFLTPRPLFFAKSINLNAPAGTETKLTVNSPRGFSKWYGSEMRFAGASTPVTGVQFSIYLLPGGPSVSGQVTLVSTSSLPVMATSLSTGTGGVSSTDIQTISTAYFWLNTPKGSACTLEYLAVIGFILDR